MLGAPFRLPGVGLGGAARFTNHFVTPIASSKNRSAEDTECWRGSGGLPALLAEA